MNTCKECGKETTNPKYCSHSCSAKSSNPKRNKMVVCPTCGKRIHNNAKTCVQHKETKYIELGNSRTKGELFARRNGYQSARSTIRKHAYRVFENSEKLRVCINCGYDKYIDVAHIKSVAMFEDSATLGEINNISNLLGLCPNCHWEFDNGILKL